MPTVLPFDRAVVRDEAFAPSDPQQPFSVHTRWIETEFDNQIPPYAGELASAGAPAERERVVVEVGGKRLEVVLPSGLGVGSARTNGSRAAAPRRSTSSKAHTAAGGNALTAPMQGTIVKIAVEEGQQVEAGDLVVVLEAMKMEQPITAHKAGTVTGLAAEVGQTVTNGAVLLELV
jgi:acetyl-CoA/propionyl-CoA carboxylase biotin carboxyl carrier protein